jgi:hypothetical protein
VATAKSHLLSSRARDETTFSTPEDSCLGISAGHARLTLAIGVGLFLRDGLGFGHGLGIPLALGRLNIGLPGRAGDSTIWRQSRAAVNLQLAEPRCVAWRAAHPIVTRIQEYRPPMQAFGPVTASLRRRSIGPAIVRDPNCENPTANTAQLSCGRELRGLTVDDRPDARPLGVSRSLSWNPPASWNKRLAS